MAREKKKKKKKHAPKAMQIRERQLNVAPACTISLNKIENEQMSNESVDCPENESWVELSQVEIR